MITEITIRGLVQGVGFRPFIYLLAKEMGVKGYVFNTTDGVIIRSDLDKTQLNEFIQIIKDRKPEVSSIHSIEVIERHDINEKFDGFEIIKSHFESNEVTQVAPDISVCRLCLNDRKSQENRLNYPFINCTHCGPRFSIVQDLPYDREQTTMSNFEMCDQCKGEYTDISNRRFHAQPIACNTCGPNYYTTYNTALYSDYTQIILLATTLLMEGKVITIKGIGGYHLACDATNEVAVARLREIKVRDKKPFAVMFPNLENLSPFVHLNSIEEKTISSWRRPIVLLKQKKQLVESINRGMKTLGCMLPYMPIHYDLFNKSGITALVVTSGNLSDYPIAIAPDEAEQQLGNKVDLIIHHNREIHNRVDDSVVQICNTSVNLLRRSRGYAPEPFFTNTSMEGIMAFGAEKTNTFAIGKGKTSIQSQYIGDLKNVETFDFYTESIARFKKLFRFSPTLLVSDLHPDYLSSIEAQRFADDSNLPLIKVQHHHAHAVACMLEHGLDEPVVAVVWDGVGLGDDEAAWGGEFLLCTRKEYKRLAHLAYVPMPGGDKASSEPWRMAVAYLHHYNIKPAAEFVERIGKEKINMLTRMIEKGINCPPTSSMGRLIDAFSSLIGVCDINTRQGESAILLEQLALEDYRGKYSDIVIQENEISLRNIFEETLFDLEQNVSREIISAKFHNFLVYLLFEKAKQLIDSTGASKLIISGGCFQNKRIVEHLQQLCADKHIDLYVPQQIPCNDSGIAVGQMAIASARIHNK